MGIERRALLQGTAVLGAGAAASSWALPEVAARQQRRAGAAVAGATAHAAQSGVLQPGRGPGRVGHYIEATPDTVQWGRLPNAATPPVATVRSGAVVTLAHDLARGRPRGSGTRPGGVLRRLRSPPAPGPPRRDRDRRLGHRPRLRGRRPPRDHRPPRPPSPGRSRGTSLEVQVLALRPRVPYGVISNRHGKGALPDIFPETPPPEPGADADHPGAVPQRLHVRASAQCPRSAARPDPGGTAPPGPDPDRSVPGDIRRRAQHLRHRQLRSGRTRAGAT